MKKHIGYFDFLRGIAIIMVVAIHTFPKSSWEAPGDYLQIAIRQILNCAVPIFLAISAFFLAKKTFDSHEKISSFWKKQIPKVYVPCLIWSLPLFMLSIINGTNIINGTLRLLCCGYSIYYFIALIIQYYLLLPILKKVSKTGGWILFLISMGSITAYLYSGVELPLILYAGPFWVWIIFFHQGICMGNSERKYPIYTLIILLILSFILQLIESYYLYKNYHPAFGIKATAFIYSYIILLILFSKQIQVFYESRKNWIFPLIEYIGKQSFGIYLIHCYILTYTSKFINSWNWGVKCLLTIALSIVVIELTKLVLPNKICSKYLGFYDTNKR